MQVIIKAWLPWESPYRESLAERDYEQADGKERIDFCLYKCPYAECVNCFGGGAKSSAGRKSKYDPEKLMRLIELRKSSAEICCELGISRRSLATYKRKIMEGIK